MESCKGQKYLTRYNAEYFVSGSDGWEDLDLGYRVDDQSWVEAVSVAPDGRSVRVVHAEGTAVHLTINSDIRFDMWYLRRAVIWYATSNNNDHLISLQKSEYIVRI